MAGYAAQRLVVSGWTLVLTALAVLAVCSTFHARTTLNRIFAIMSLASLQAYQDQAESRARDH